MWGRWESEYENRNFVIVLTHQHSLINTKMYQPRSDWSWSCRAGRPSVFFGSDSLSHTFLKPPLTTSKQPGWMVSWGKGSPPSPPAPQPDCFSTFYILCPTKQSLFYFRTLFSVDSFSCPSPPLALFLNSRLIPILLWLKLLSGKISRFYGKKELCQGPFFNI